MSDRDVRSWHRPTTIACDEGAVYGITVQRRFEPPIVGQLLARPDAEILTPPAV